MGSIYEELLEYSKKLEPWQRDALRRHAESPVLLSTEIKELVDLAFAAALSKEDHLIDDETKFDLPDVVPLAEVHVPSKSSENPGVRLTQVRHIHGVNRMRPDAAIDLNPQGLNIVFGLNGVGKSGYTRILKRSCHSKYPETVTSNVFRPEAADPRAQISYKMGDADHLHEWTLTDDSEDINLPRVAVYDSKTAAAHVSRKGTELTVAPEGLDLLTDLIGTYDAVAGEVRRRKSALIALPQPSITFEAMDAEVKSALSLLGQREGYLAAQTLAVLSEEEQADLESLPGEISHLKTSSQEARLAQAQHHAVQRTTQARRIESLAQQVNREQIATLSASRNRVREIEQDEAAQVGHDFTGEEVPGVHSDRWKAMWTAVKNYAENDAYPERTFPSEDIPRCVLCHQPMSTETHARLQRFNEAFAQDLAAEKADLNTRVEQIITGIQAAANSENIDDALLKVLEIDNGSYVAQLRDDLKIVRGLLDEVKKPVSSPETFEAAIAPFISGTSSSSTDSSLMPGLTVADRLVKVADEMDRAAALYNDKVSAIQAESAGGVNLAELQVKLQNLTDRSRLASVLPEIKALHNRKVHVSLYENVLNQCRTKALSAKSRAVCVDYVQMVADEFRHNLRSLEDPDLSEDRRLQIDITAGKVDKGVSSIAFTVKGATNAKTPADGVLSEGEMRAVSISAFLADVASSEDGSAIIFDDPMTSLDHSFQERVAKKLVKEARHRQVIVFTHSTAFIGALWFEGVKKDWQAQVNEAIETPTPVETRFIEIDKHPALGTGIQVAQSQEPTKGYNGCLAEMNNLLASAKEHYVGGQMAAYASDCMQFGNTLRKAWEYAVEEFVISGVVARNKPSVSTQNLRYLLALQPQDIVMVNKGMETNNVFVHSSGAGSEEPLPDPKQLESRRDELTEWVRDFKTRKNKV